MSGLHRARRSGHRLLAVSAVVFLGGAGISAMLTGPARAETADTGWGPQGAIPSSSAVTVRWDNHGNPAEDTVDHGPYNAATVASQPIPHTLDPATGKPATYADLATLPGATTTNNADVNAAAVFQDAQLTVSQTQDLAHQSVTVGFSGVVGNNFHDHGGPSVVLMQCWGAAGETQPDPSHCEAGSPGAADTSVRSYGGSRITAQDQYLTNGGDYTIATDPLVWLTGAMTSTGDGKATAELVARVPTDATGTLEFDDAQGVALKTGVPVTDGVASIEVPGQVVAENPTYTATYHAAAADRYASAVSASLVLPAVRQNAGTTSETSGNFATRGNTAPAGTLVPFVFPAGTFTPGQPVSLELDDPNGTPLPLGTADSFGGLTADWTVPADLTGDHKVYVTGFVTPQNWTPYASGVSLTVQPLPTSGTAPIAQPTFVPFAAIDGTQIYTGSANGNAYFTPTSTNEQVDFEAAASATQTVTRTFEVDTGGQAPGLGCGARPDEPSTATCWLVAVPMGYTGALAGISSLTSPLSPSQWAQRMQVRLQFSPVQVTCSGAESAVQAAGSETLGAAMASWIPSVCGADGIGLSYATVVDAQARTDYANGSPGLVFSSAPVDDDADNGLGPPVYIPVGLTGVTIAFRAIDTKTMLPPTSLKLDARLIVKLLTESMNNAVDPTANSQPVDGPTPVLTKIPWSWSAHGGNYVGDQELQALNPNVGLAAFDGSSGGSQADILVSSDQADGIDLLWQWLVHDPDAKAFLDGCPDPWGMTINPFYSTRSYAECPDQKDQLDSVAAAKIAVTAPYYPASYTYTPATYPPAPGITFPQPGYYQRDAVSATATVEAQLPLTLADIHPRDASLTDVGVDVSHGLEKTNTLGCFVDQQSAAQCGAAPGQTMTWTNSATKGFFNNVLGLTDTATAAQYQLPTAQLCTDYDPDTAGDVSCVGANTASLQKAADGFATSAGVPVPSAIPDIAGGAYPLTLPVYAEASPTALGTDGSHTVAKVLATITTSGQQPGFQQGNLPPGYAPLTSALAAIANKGIAALNAVTTPTTSPTPRPSGSASSSTPARLASSPSAAPSPLAALSPLADTGVSSGASHASSSQAPSQQAKPAGLVVKTPSTPSGFPRVGIAVGLAGGVACGGASGLLGLRRRRAKAR